MPTYHGLNSVLDKLKSFTKSLTYRPIKLDGFYRALVMCSKDPLKAGRVKVWIPGLMHEKDRERGVGLWAFATSFWVGTNANATNDHSYNMMKDFGSLMPPPDGSYVYVFFENGDFNKCRYLPFGPALIGGEPKDYEGPSPFIPQENQNGPLWWFKWLLMKTPFGRAIFLSDDPDDASVIIRGYNRQKRSECKSDIKPCEYPEPDSADPVHWTGDQGKEYDGINSPKAHNNKKQIASQMLALYEGHNKNGETHDLVLLRDHRHNFVKFSSQKWKPNPNPVDFEHCGESKAHIEWAIFEHEKNRNEQLIDRTYLHANIKLIMNTEKTHACEDDKFEFSEENIEYMAQMPDWVDIEQNGHRFWMNLKNGNPVDGCVAGGGSIDVRHYTKPIVDVIIDGRDCKYNTPDSFMERRAVGVFRAEHGLKWVVGEDTPEDEDLFREYHSGKRFMEYLFNGEFLIQDVNHQGHKGFIELFPGCSPQEVNGDGEFKFYARLCDGHSLWESELADTSIEMIPLAPGICDPKTVAGTYLRLTGRGKALLQSKKGMFVELRESGGCANGHGHTFLLLEENGHVLLKGKSGSYIEITPSGHIIINSVAGGGNIYEN